MEIYAIETDGGLDLESDRLSMSKHAWPPLTIVASS